MRYLFCILFIITSHFVLCSEPNAVPQVPSNIEIAGIKLKITDDARKEIQKDVNALRASDKYFRVKLDRVNLYFPIIERVLKEEGVPDDLKYLSVQESALISDAVSTSDAVGYWQFKDFTAREVGLRVDNKVDERKNIVSATHGAAKYFKRNNMFFNNWIYAVNAYMTGPGGAQRFVDKANFGKDRMTIDKNTHWYVLRFIAHLIAFKDEIGEPHSEGLSLVEYTNGANKDLDHIADKFKVDKELVKDYNKWLRQGKVPDDKIYTVIIPVTGKVPRIKEETPMIVSAQKEEATVKYPAVLSPEIINQRTLEVELNGLDAVIAGRGEDLKKLAEKAGISPQRLEKYNDLRPNEELKAGDIYYTQRKRNRSPIRYHIAQHNESLWDISQKYGIRLEKLARKNGMEIGDPVKPGRLMWLRKNRPEDAEVVYHNIPQPKPVVKKDPPKPEPKTEVITKEPEVTTATEESDVSIPVVAEDAPVERVTLFKYHLVREGETLDDIAGFYEIDVVKILGWNEMAAGNEVRVGQNLRLKTDREITPLPPRKTEVKTDPQPETITAKPPVNSSFHTVVSGESLWSISRKYGVTVEELQEWNGLIAGQSISPGQKLSLKTETATDLNAPKSEPEPKDPVNPEGKKTHVVDAGESLWAIAKMYEVTIEQLQEWNQLGINDALKIGQELKIIEEVKATKEAESDDYATLIVKAGDSLYKIAQQFGMTVEEIMELNNLESSSLSIGDELKVKKQ